LPVPGRDPARIIIRPSGGLSEASRHEGNQDGRIEVRIDLRAGDAAGWDAVAIDVSDAVIVAGASE